MLNTHLNVLNFVSMFFLVILTPYALLHGEAGLALGATGAVLVANAYYTIARRHL